MKRNNKYLGYLLYINPIVDIIQNPIHNRETLDVLKKRDGTDWTDGLDGQDGRTGRTTRQL